MKPRHPRTPLLHGALALALGALAPGAAQAWGSLLLIDPPPQQASFAAGPSIWRLPAYAGSKSSRTWLIPGLDYEHPSGFFASTDSGVGWNFAPRTGLQAGLRLWPQFGRSAADAPPGIGGLGTCAIKVPQAHPRGGQGRGRGHGEVGCCLARRLAG